MWAVRPDLRTFVLMGRPNKPAISSIGPRSHMQNSTRIAYWVSIGVLSDFDLTMVKHPSPSISPAMYAASMLLILTFNDYPSGE